MLLAYDDGVTCNRSPENQKPSLTVAQLLYLQEFERVLLSLYPYIASLLAPISNLYIANDTND